MGGLFNRLKTWAFKETVKSADLNGEFDNIINNLTPSKLDTYSKNVSQMQIQTNPGGLGTESLAPSTAGEIERIRFVIARLLGNTYWYQSPAISISNINTLLEQSLGVPPNRLISGRVRTTSQQPIFLAPAGSSNSVTLKATTTNFVYVISNNQLTQATDVVFNSLTAAPSTQNTATVSDPNVSSDFYAGEFDAHIPTITIASVGTNITAQVGSLAAFKVTNGSGTEYFLAYVNSATTLTNAYRGFFFDNSDAPIQRIGISNGDTLQLMKLSWIFVTTTGTLDVVYTNPVIAAVAPASPSIGDYWYDLVNQEWKKYNGSTFAVANAILIGMTIQDTSNCVGARSLEFFVSYSDLNTMFPVVTSNTHAMTTSESVNISVYGNKLNFAFNFFNWDQATDIESPFTIQANTSYWLYVTEQGKPVISPIKPYDRTFDFFGKYHPYNTWRSIGSVPTDGSSHFTVADNIIENIDELYIEGFNPSTSFGTTNQKIRRVAVTPNINSGSAITYVDDAALGASFTINKNGTYSITYVDSFTGVSSAGISKNTTQPNTSILMISAAERIVSKDAAVAGNRFDFSIAAIHLKKGDILRLHTDGVTPEDSAVYSVSIRIVRIG